ncbi:MAG: hypothetical protein KKG75_05060 [Nanoarchaeota archaeon]|nr:hypothetical protein [Nanoarchaeota archaeon]
MVYVADDKSKKELILFSNVIINRVKNLARKLEESMKKEKAEIITNANVLRVALKSYFRKPDESLLEQIFEFIDIMLGNLSNLVRKLEGESKKEAGNLCDDAFRLEKMLESIFR